MNRLKYLIIGIFALSLTGCGQTVIETLKVTDGPGYNEPGTGKSIVILPFADYSQGNLESAHRRNMIITETLTDQLVKNGFGLPVQEDVFEYLVNQDIIDLSAYEKVKNSSLVAELSNEWSDAMKQQLKIYIQSEDEKHSSRALSSSGAHGLTTKKLAKIGRHFKADYIMRGRILEYKTRQEATWAPWKKGILPFINGGASRIMFGFASSDAYDEENEQLMGALLGGRFGYSSVSWPWEKGESVFGRTGQDANTVLWAGAGYGLGKVSHRSGQVDQATVQMRIWVQEATTGNVVWTNRVRVQVSPETFMADHQYDTLFNKAIEKGVTTLVNHFVTYGL